MSEGKNCAKGLWFPDGNLIIRAGDRVCLVHKSVLASHSPVLADMFSIPQPDIADMVDGIPAMTFPDPPKEVLHWLRAMLVPGYFDMHPHAMDLVRLFAVLRLSHKYDVQHLRRRALGYLASLLPVDVEAAQTPWYWHGAPLDFFIPTYAVAHEVGALWLIPSIIYRLHAHQTDEPGFLDDINTHTMPLKAQLITQLYKLSQLISEHFSAGSTVGIRRDCHPTPPPRDRPPSCDSSWEDLDRWMKGLRQDPLHFYGKISGSPAATTGLFLEDCESMCDSCRNTMQAYVEYACTAFWDAIPDCLGLPAWGDLLAAKARDLAIPISAWENVSEGSGEEDA